VILKLAFWLVILFIKEMAVSIATYLLVTACFLFGNYQVVSTTPVNGSCIGSISETEYGALQALYESAHGENWTWNRVQSVTSVWTFPSNRSVPCTNNWYGLNCSSLLPSVCTIADLDLRSFGLFGTLPEGFFNLTSLLTLELGNNNITGTIPSTISLMTNLTAFKIQTNNLSGWIPTYFGLLARLTQLYLYGNDLDGPLPSELGLLSGLQSLQLQRNMLSGPISSYVGQLSARLVVLNLCENELTGSLPTELGSLTRLISLKICDNLLLGSVPSQLGQLTAITYLNLGGNSFSALPSTIGRMKGLIELYGFYNLFREIPETLFELPYLYTLVLDLNLLTGSLVSAAALEINGSSRKWDILDLSYNFLSGTVPADLSGRVIYLGNNFLSGTLGNISNSIFLDSVFTGVFNHFSGSLSNLFLNNSHRQAWVLDSNLFTGTLPPIEEACSEISVENNFLSGVLPADYFLLEYLFMSFNILSRSLPPIDGLSRLFELEVNANMISGKIPVSLFVNGLLDLSNNSLTGQIPDHLLYGVELAYLGSNKLTGPLLLSTNYSRLYYLDASYNLLNGSLPSLSGMHLNDLILEGNRFTGGLVVDCSAVEYLFTLLIGSNLLSGDLSHLPCFRNITVLSIYNNSFTGTLEYLEKLTNLQEIIINNNRLSGTLPSFISTFARLQALIIAGNFLVGHPDVMFNRSAQTILTAVDISDNDLTGPIPSVVFTLPSLESFASIKTCFRGSLPATICNCTTLRVLLMDGITGGQGCQRRFALDDLFKANAYISTNGPVEGGIPSCIWKDLPLLTSLHLSSNGLTGSINIPADSSINNLTSIVLSYNQLSGTIPQALLTLPFTTMELSSNRFKGTIDGTLQQSNATIYLANNRLSGYIPVSFSSSTGDISVMEGNLFDCNANQPKPDADKHAANTACGSASFDNALIAWGSTAFLCSFLLVLLVGSGGLIISLKKEARKQIAMIWPLFKAYMSGCSSIARFSSVTTMQLEQLYLETKVHLAPCLPQELTTPGSSLYDYVAVLLHLISFQTAFLTGSVTLGIIVFLVLKFARGGEFSTHTYQYQWLVSSAFLTGIPPAVSLLVLWMLTIVLFVSIVGKFDLAREAWQRQQMTVNPAQTKTPLATREWHRSLLSFLRNTAQLACIAFLIINILVLVALNAGYLYILLSGNYSVRAVAAAQVCVSIFKVGWSLLGIPTGIQLVRSLLPVELENDVIMFVQLKFWCNTLNSVVLPFVVSLFVNSLCFLDLFIPQSVINENFAYNLASRIPCVTNRTVSEANDDYNVLPKPKNKICLSYGVTQQFVAEFDPPFTYSFQCGSSIITSYVPVLVYSCACRFLVAVIRFALDIYFDNGKLGKCCSKRVSSPIKDGNFLSHLLVECVVLLTFGMSSPPLAAITVLCILMELLGHIQAIARFVIAKGAAENSSKSIDVHNAVSSIWMLAGAGVWPCIHVASVYWALLLFDMVGDTNVHHPAEATWAPVLVVALPVLFRVALHYWHLRRIRLDKQTSLIVSQQSIVTMSAMHGHTEILRSVSSEGDIALTDLSGIAKSQITPQESNSSFSNIDY
jgi:hypothetical protein